MEDRHRDSDTLVRGTRIIVERSRLYKVREKYYTLHVFSKTLTDVQLLRDLWGGNYYSHGVGFTWMLSTNTKLLQILEDLEQLGIELPDNLVGLRGLQSG